MPVNATIPVTGDYREVILPAGYADNARCLLIGGDHLFLCTDTVPGSLLKVRKDDFSVRSVLTFVNDTEHDNAIDAVYVAGSTLANDRIYVLFGWGPATPGLLMVSQVNPNSDSNNAPTIVNEDYVREEDFTPGFAGCIDSDGTNLYVLSGYVDPIRIATVRLSDAGVAFSPALSPHANGWVLRASGGRLYAVGKTLDEFGDTWVKRINPGPPINPPNPSNPSVETAITITNGTDFYLMPEDIGVSTDHLWIGMRGNPAGFGKIKKVTKSGLTVTDFTTGILAAARTVKLAGSFIWGLFDNGKAARINPSTGDIRLYTLNDGQGFQSLINTDADGFLYTAWYQTGTKIARYRIPSDIVQGDCIWSRRAQGDNLQNPSINSSTGRTLAIDSSGNTFVGGVFKGLVHFGNGYDLDSGGIKTSIFLAKYAPGGNLLWAKAFGPTGNDSIVYSLKIDSSGKVLMAGGFQGTLNFGGGNTIVNSNPSNKNIFVARLTNDGDYDLAVKFGNTNASTVTGMELSGSNIVITGFFAGTLDMGNSLPVLNASGDFDIVLATLNSSLVSQWANKYGGNFSDTVNAISLDGSNNIYIGGVFLSTSIDFGGGTMTGTGGRDSFIAKFNSAGVHQASLHIRGTGDQYLFGLAADAAGNVVADGAFSVGIQFGTGGPSMTAPGEFNTIWIAKFSTSLSPSWFNQYGGRSADQGGPVAIDSNGRIYLGGFAKSNINFGNGVTSFGGGNNDVLLVVFNSGGVAQWTLVDDTNTRPITGGANNSSIDIRFDSCGNPIMAGVFSGRINFGCGEMLSSENFKDAAFVVSIAK